MAYQRLEERLRALIDYHENIAKSIRLTLDTLSAEDRISARNGHVGKLAKAITARAELGDSRHAKMEARLAALSELLDHNETYRIREIETKLETLGHTMSVKTLTDSLKKLGWSVTGQSFNARWVFQAKKSGRTTKTTKKTIPNTAEVKQNRQRTAKLIAFLDNATAPVPAKAFKKYRTTPGVLLRYGYIKASGDGYVRTDKEFTA